MFSMVVKTAAAFAIFMGLMMVAGSAGDCDGACMENANTLGEMMAIILMGFFLMAAGVFTLTKA
jgi:hypothetical protein